MEHVLWARPATAGDVGKDSDAGIQTTAQVGNALQGKVIFWVGNDIRVWRFGRQGFSLQRIHCVGSEGGDGWGRGGEGLAGLYLDVFKSLLLSQCQVIASFKALCSSVRETGP